MNVRVTSTRVRTLNALLVAILISILGIGEAVANPYNYNGTQPSGYGGSANYQGTMQFQDKNSFSQLAYVQDICPGDGVGASIYYAVYFNDSSNWLSPVDPQDTNGCGNGFNSGAGTITRPKRIDYAIAVGCLTNDGNPCFAVIWTSGNKDNPYTGN